MRHRWIGLGLFLVAMVSWLGCSDDNPLGRQAVSGAVTLDGVPLASGSLSFTSSEGGPVLGGCIIKDGAYSISTEQGLTPGKYLVRINAPDMSFFKRDLASRAHETPPNLAPPEYNERSDKTVQVTKEGPNKFNFDMQTKR